MTGRRAAGPPDEPGHPDGPDGPELARREPASRRERAARGPARTPRRPAQDDQVREPASSQWSRRAKPEAGRSAPQQPVEAPSRQDPVVRASSAFAGGPVGRRLAGTPFWGALPVLVLLAVAVLAAGVVQKEHCRAQGWTSPDQFWHACYSDIAVLHGSAGLGSDERPTLAEAVGQGGLGQPPLASAAMWAVSWFAGGTGSGSALRFFDLSTLLLAVLLIASVVMLAVALRERRWGAAHLALSPLLLTSALVSYQLLAVALSAGVLLAASRGRMLLAGVLLGLAVAAAPQLAVIGLAALLLAGRDAADPAGRFRPEPVLVLLAAAALVWTGLRVILFGGLGGGLADAWQGWRSAGPGYGSIWLVPQLLEASRPRTVRWWFEGASLDAGTTTALSLIVLLAVLVAGVAVTVLATRRPTLAPLALMLLVGVLLANKSLPVQASLLLLPLIAASGLAWRDHLVWVVPELAYFAGVWLYIAGQTTPDRGLPANLYLLLLLGRVAALVWVGVQAGRIALRGGAADLVLPAGAVAAETRDLTSLWTGFRDGAPAPLPSPGQTH